MGMTTNIVYGYGFYVYASDEQLYNFIIKHKSTLENWSRGRDLIKYLEEKSIKDGSFNPKEDFYDYESLDGDIGIYGMIADVMMKETGIRFEYVRPQNEDEDDAIILRETFPWNYNVMERRLTEDKLMAICGRYICDLGGQLKHECISIEYYG